MKKLALIFVLAGVLSVTTVLANLDPPIPPLPPPQPWKSGETTITLSQDGTLTVSGNGAMEDYIFGHWNVTHWNSAVRYGVAPPITAVVIEEGVTHIGDNAFWWDYDMTSITVAANNAHYSSKDGVLFNKDKTAIILYPRGRQQDVYTIPNGVTTIEKQAFYGCLNLVSVTIPNSVVTIGERAFSNFRHLTPTTNIDSVKNFSRGGEMLSESRLTSITIPNSVTYIGKKAFSESGLTSITIPGSVKTIGDEAFSDCDILTSVTFEEGVTTIGDCAFIACGLTPSITIPKSVTYIGSLAFANCFKLGSVTFLNHNPPEIDYQAFLHTNPYFIFAPARSTFKIIVFSILSALILSAVVFVIIKKSRKKQGKERRK